MHEAGRATGGTVDWLDRVALSCSAACLIHCLALPLVVAALPALSTMLDVPEAFHRWVRLLAAPAAALALAQGRRRHGRGWPLVVGAGGVALLVVAALVMPEGWGETATTVAGSLLLGWAHLANWRLRRRCAG